ncbi:hypothetical protein Unana1_01316 [Umbelopsis nana]
MPQPAAKRQRVGKRRPLEIVKRDLLTLPQEIVFLVFSFLDAADLTTCARVSTKWYAAANDEQTTTCAKAAVTKVAQQAREREYRDAQTQQPGQMANSIQGESQLGDWELQGGRAAAAY